MRPYDSIYDPQHLGGSGGEDLILPGSEQPGDLALGEQEVPLDQTGESQVPYVEVFQSYEQAYRQAVENGQVPVQLRKVVRDYFSSLEP